MIILWIALGGFAGSIARFYISVKTNKHVIGTWTANVTGSILLALLFYFHMTDSISEWIWFFLGIGFSGAYTTFSTFGNETLQFILNRKYVHAASYVTASLTISLFVVFIVFSLFTSS
ncbi:CrcB family protein [Virgibacillus sp. NKC19-3]|uniref:fluoride efflux transporter FluC n=1 Tax=Virgibacillus saliphilus TaxID=2831674 RepID=UPI001C9B9F7D|nr:CrcB family protein [Virgibacillus sp. NKC19-3]MBY7144023.1 CrcB family protein [Virgibacillus sp. NKC19-3]